MIEINFAERNRKDGTTLEMTVNGHANYDEIGKDIVCSGVSAITQALAGYVMNANDNHEIIKAPNDGYIHILVVNVDKEVNAAFEMALIGLMQIELAYPKNVKVNMKITSEKK